MLSLALWLFFFSTPFSAFAAPLRIAAAADLKFALADIVAAYREARPKEEVVTTFGSSGKFRTQILAGAPFDLFFSADPENAEAVSAAGKGEAVFAYARGRLSLWARKDASLVLCADLKCLDVPSVLKISIGNAAHAPYGKIAEEALQKAGLLGSVSGKLVRGDNIAQAAQFVESGAASVGIIATSLAESPALRAKGKSAAVSETLYTPLRQSAVVIKGNGAEAARRFKIFFQSKEAKSILRRHGLDPL